MIIFGHGHNQSCQEVEKLLYYGNLQLQGLSESVEKEHFCLLKPQCFLVCKLSCTYPWFASIQVLISSFVPLVLATILVRLSLRFNWIFRLLEEEEEK
ncbi:hypothetical protein F0562_022821 [Nyssa sinensis]|uniref:Transmembrane protein n=1 Tax=Nyssa sinensis TaxID=561372 RepID=A0A5J5BFZ7_9ASTE|nr:hypothetical protein F0562_022821 [Nyssa sinensis]